MARRGRIPDLDLTWFHGKELDKTATGLQFGVRVPLWNAFAVWFVELPLS